MTEHLIPIPAPALLGGRQLPELFGTGHTRSVFVCDDINDAEEPIRLYVDGWNNTKHINLSPQTAVQLAEQLQWLAANHHQPQEQR